MRTYSHALLTGAAARRLRPGDRGALAWSMAGAALPDLPVAVAAVWFVARRGGWTGRPDFYSGACERRPVALPDSVLHSPLAPALLLPLALAMAGRPGGRGSALALLAGWAGHIACDLLTHADDARPVLWPISEVRLRSPISYWDPKRHAIPFALLEHAASLAAAWSMLTSCGGPAGDDEG